MWPFLAEIYQIPYLTLKNLGQGHDENRPKSNQVIYRSGPTIVPKMKEIQKVVQKLSREQESPATAAAAAYEPVQKHKVIPSILGWLNNLDIQFTTVLHWLTNISWQGIMLCQRIYMEYICEIYFEILRQFVLIYHVMNKDYYHLLKCQYIDFKQLGPTFILIIKSKEIKLK